MSEAEYEQFRIRWELWKDCLNGSDRHSIMRQICAMVWNTGVFRVINEARRIAPAAEEGGVQVNGTMHSLINVGFFEGQMLAIRRLTDDHPLTSSSGERDVFSLISLLKDMKKCARLMTRANILRVDGLDYDINHHWQEHCPLELSSMRSRERHEEMDFFARVTPEKRSPEDSVRPEILDYLQDKVEHACESIHKYVNKFVAHAATPGSRQVADADSAGITLNHLYAGQAAICSVACFIALHILTGTNHGLLALPQYDYLAYIDCPLATKDSIPTLEQTWRLYDEETRGWASWGIDDLRAEIQTHRERGA